MKIPKTGLRKFQENLLFLFIDDLVVTAETEDDLKT